jgi:hypothetical protein
MSSASSARSRVDLADFVWIWNWRQHMPTPALHIQICRWLSCAWKRGDRELLLLAFRSSGKSTLVGLFCAWLLLHDPDIRILVLAGDFALAKKMARNVKRVIERHPLTRRLRPLRSDNWASDQFTVVRATELRDPSVLAKGISANITGLRADVVICDDVEVPNTCDTAAKRFDLRHRLQEIDYVLSPGGVKLFVGTPHTFYSIYARDVRPETGEARPLLAHFERLELPVLDAHGRSRWKQRFPVEHLDAMRQTTGPAKFNSQMMLQPRSILESRLDPTRLRPYPAELEYAEGNRQTMLSLGGRRLLSASCWWDPAYGAPQAGDDSVIAAVFTDDQGDYWLHRVAYLRHDPAIREQVDEATQMCRQVAQFAKDLYLPAISVETNGLGRFLPGLLRNELRRAGVLCAVTERSSCRNKDLRIADAFDAVLAAGRLHAHESVLASRFVEEMREWRPGSRGRDDGLDAVAGCLLNEPVRLARVPPPKESELAFRNWRPHTAATVVDPDYELL